MGDWTPPEKRFSELPLRLLTALVLIPFALFAVWMGSWWLALGCSAFCAVMMFEWCRMSATPLEWVLTALAALFGLSLALPGFVVSLSIFISSAVLAVWTSPRMVEAKISGRVLEYTATPGAMVKAGDLLARLENQEIQAKVDQAKQ